jgi:hypothetical protein
VEDLVDALAMIWLRTLQIDRLDPALVAAARAL